MENNKLDNVPSTKTKKAQYDEFLKTVDSYQKQVNALRLDGTDTINKINSEIRNIKSNKQIDAKDKQKIIAKDKELILEAKRVENTNKPAVNSIIKEAVNYIETFFKTYYASEKIIANEAKAQILLEEKENKAKVIADFAEKEKDLQIQYASDKEALKEQMVFFRKDKRQTLEDVSNMTSSALQKQKDHLHNLMVEKQTLIKDLRDGKATMLEAIKNKYENYIYNFTWTKFLLQYGLYIIIILFMIVCIIIQPSLINWLSITDILKNFSTKIFFALGVAGLILLAGTDLSVGRMVTMSSLFTCMILNPNSATEFFGISFNGIYSTLGFGGAVVVALLISILSCTLFSAIAGFFSAKFKIHPFISTLGTSLVIWGLMCYSTANTKTGTVSDEASSIVQSIGGSFNFPLTLIYAIIAITVVWFIWNKTKFGKNMYAVGGNPEAASVSGISVFKITMGVFIMAGILYGLGGFFQGLVTGSSSTSLGQGWEMEAIAACVIGGISFTGGIGKISGAVIGCLLFEILKMYLRGITGGNADIANIFIGTIIVLAVTFDSIKYLKKK